MRRSKTFPLVAPAVWLALFSLSLPAAPPALSQQRGAPQSERAVEVQNQVRRLVNAVYTADVETAMSFTHPEIVAMTGGDAAARTALGETFLQIEEAGLQLERIYFPSDPVFLDGEVNEYVVAPTAYFVKSGERTMHSISYQLGSRPKGTEKWVFVEGSRVTPELMDQVFPDFPSDFELPQVRREML